MVSFIGDLEQNFNITADEFDEFEQMLFLPGCEPTQKPTQPTQPPNPTEGPSEQPTREPTVSKLHYRIGTNVA
jgi:hypothetical protein